MYEIVDFSSDWTGEKAFKFKNILQKAFSQIIDFQHYFFCES